MHIILAFYIFIIF